MARPLHLCISKSLIHPGKSMILDKVLSVPEATPAGADNSRPSLDSTLSELDSVSLVVRRSGQYITVSIILTV